VKSNNFAAKRSGLKFPGQGTSRSGEFRLTSTPEYFTLSFHLVKPGMADMNTHVMYSTAERRTIQRDGRTTLTTVQTLLAH